jgi:hypothetical protein
MYAVGDVDVGDAGPGEDVAVTHRRAVVGVAGGIFGPVRLGLDYDAGGEALGGLVDEGAAEKVDRDLARVPVVEIGP